MDPILEPSEVLEVVHWEYSGQTSFSQLHCLGSLMLLVCPNKRVELLIECFKVCVSSNKTLP